MAYAAAYGSQGIRTTPKGRFLADTCRAVDVDGLTASADDLSVSGRRERLLYFATRHCASVGATGPSGSEPVGPVSSGFGHFQTVDNEPATK